MSSRSSCSICVVRSFTAQAVEVLPREVIPPRRFEPTNGQGRIVRQLFIVVVCSVFVVGFRMLCVINAYRVDCHLSVRWSMMVGPVRMCLGLVPEFVQDQSCPLLRAMHSSDRHASMYPMDQLPHATGRHAPACIIGTIGYLWPKPVPNAPSSCPRLSLVPYSESRRFVLKAMSGAGTNLRNEAKVTTST